MPVTVAIGPPQADGCLWITETHADAEGVIRVWQYRSFDPSGAQAIADARHAAILALLADEEVERRLAVDASPLPLRFQTGAEFLARVRALFRGARGERAWRIARWLTRRIDAGDVTVAQLRSAFGLTLAQWDALELRLRDMRGKVEALDAAEGE